MSLEDKDHTVITPRTKKSNELGSSRKLSTQVHFDHNQTKALPEDWIKSIW